MQTKKGYKVFDPDWTCSPNGNKKQYSCPGIFVVDGELAICSNGIHFCENLIDCFNYYSIDPKNHVAEVIARGDIQERENKICTNKLEIVRELAWVEVLQLVNTGEGNTGINNAGDYNTGIRNGGNCNAGDRNSGNHNAGDYNTGNYNTGDCNVGDRNAGDRNTGNYNIGDYNAGDYNAGDYNTGNRNSGNHNAGDYNTGNYNAGIYNTGNCNAGDCNTGNYNAGACNVGDRNAGNRNVGSYNIGYRNVGDCNTGSCNIGDYNTGWYNVGCFNTVTPTILLFNKPSDWTYQDWTDSSARRLLCQCPAITTKWIPYSEMTEQERKDRKDRATKGYLKTERNPETVQDWWDGLTKEEQNIIRSIPNFDAAIFEEVTGIKVE